MGGTYASGAYGYMGTGTPYSETPYGGPIRQGGSCLGWDANALGNGTGWMTVETYVGSKQEANAIASAVVGGGLAQTGHMEKAESTYWWQGQLVTGDEWRISFDVSQGGAQAVANGILASHPYRLPVILLRPFTPATIDARDWLMAPMPTGTAPQAPQMPPTPWG